MVTLESNRGQAATATPPFERQTQDLPPSTETPTRQPQAETRGTIPLHDPVRFMSLVVAGATIGSMWGLGTTVLAILGLSGVTPIYMLPVAGITLGLALLTLGGIDRAWARMFPFAEDETRHERTAFSSGTWAVTFAGFAGIVLGIFNLAYLTGARFGALAAIVFGLGLFWHSGVMRRVSRFPYHGVEVRQLRGPLAINALTVAPLRDFFAGLGGVILGLLALFNLAPLTLGFVALLAMSVALVFTTSTVCSATLAALEGHCAKSRS
jgi:hypothetical protein